MEFYERYTSLADNQILEILKKRKDYQNEAVNAAIKVAIERQLIHSEQDLFSPEFQYNQPKGSPFFPEIADEYQRQKLAGSIFRFLFILSLVPVIYAFLKYGEGELNWTFIGAGIGMIWFLFSYILYRTRKVVLMIPMFILLLAIFLFIGTIIFTKISFRYLDLIMLFVGAGLPSYLLLLLKKLIQAKPEKL